MSDYRAAFFSKYMSTHWDFAEKDTHESKAIYTSIYNKQIKPHLPESKNATILDIACGTGTLLRYIQELGYENSSGIDLGDQQLKIAQERGVRNVVKGNFFDVLSAEGGQFDCIIASQVIEHLYKSEALSAMELISRRLVPGGRALVMTPNVATLGGITSAFGDFTHELFFTSRSLMQLMRVSGFSNVQVFGLGPVGHDMKSAVRAQIWGATKQLLRFRLKVERGTGRGIWDTDTVLDPILMAVGIK